MARRKIRRLFRKTDKSGRPMPSNKSKGEPNAGSPSLKSPSGVLFSYYKGYRHNFEEWFPTDYQRWLPLIEWFGPETPAREYCSTELFMSNVEREQALEAYKDALKFWWSNHKRGHTRLLYKYISNIEEYFKNAKLL